MGPGPLRADGLYRSHLQGGPLAAWRFPAFRVGDRRWKRSLPGCKGSRSPLSRMWSCRGALGSCLSRAWTVSGDSLVPLPRSLRSCPHFLSSVSPTQLLGNSPLPRIERQISELPEFPGVLKPSTSCFPQSWAEFKENLEAGSGRWGKGFGREYL